MLRFDTPPLIERAGREVSREELAMFAAVATAAAEQAGDDVRGR